MSICRPFAIAIACLLVSGEVLAAKPHQEGAQTAIEFFSDLLSGKVRPTTPPKPEEPEPVEPVDIDAPAVIPVPFDADSEGEETDDSPVPKLNTAPPGKKWVFEQDDTPAAPTPTPAPKALPEETLFDDAENALKEADELGNGEDELESIELPDEDEVLDDLEDTLKDVNPDEF